jgi:hypothetical protein
LRLRYEETTRWYHTIASEHFDYEIMLSTFLLSSVARCRGVSMAWLCFEVLMFEVYTSRACPKHFDQHYHSRKAREHLLLLLNRSFVPRGSSLLNISLLQLRPLLLSSTSNIKHQQYQAFISSSTFFFFFFSHQRFSFLFDSSHKLAALVARLHFPLRIINTSPLHFSIPSPLPSTISTVRCTP